MNLCENKIEKSLILKIKLNDLKIKFKKSVLIRFLFVFLIIILLITFIQLNLVISHSEQLNKSTNCLKKVRLSFENLLNLISFFFFFFNFSID